MDTNTNDKPNLDASDVIERAFNFVRIVRTSPDIFEALSAYGFTPQALEEGWSLLYKVARMDGVIGLGKGVDVAGAIRELDAWDEKGFELAHIALRRQFPEQEDYLFRNLAPTKGPQAVLGVKVFLDRLDELESSPTRTATKAQDQAAIAALAARGIDAALRAKLKSFVETATSAPDGATVLAANMEPKPEDVAALSAWYEDWSATARIVIKRRDLLVRLGLLRRRRPARPAAATPAVTPAKPAVSSTTEPNTPIAPVINAPAPSANGIPVVPPVSMPVTVLG